MHIPDDPNYYEKFYFTPGDLGFRRSTRDMRGWPLVCWDQWYPEAARLAALRGAQILLQVRNGTKYRGMAATYRGLLGNDVSQNLFQFVSDTNVEKIPYRIAFPHQFEPRITSVTGTRDNFWGSVDEFFDGSDSFIYSDSSVGVPASYLEDWPDPYFHTSGISRRTWIPQSCGEAVSLQPPSPTL